MIRVFYSGAPQVVALTVDLDEYFIDEEGVAEALVFALQSAAISEQIFDVSVTEIEPMVEPNGILDDGWRKPVTFVDVG